MPLRPSEDRVLFPVNAAISRLRGDLGGQPVVAVDVQRLATAGMPGHQAQRFDEAHEPDRHQQAPVSTQTRAPVGNPLVLLRRHAL